MQNIIIEINCLLVLLEVDKNLEETRSLNK